MFIVISSQLEYIIYDYSINIELYGCKNRQESDHLLKIYKEILPSLNSLDVRSGYVTRCEQYGEYKGVLFTEKIIYYYKGNYIKFPKIKIIFP